MCVSSTPVALYLYCLSVAMHASKSRRWEMYKPEDSDTFFEVEHKHSTPVAVLTMHAITNLLYSVCVNDLCRPLEKYICVSKKDSSTCFLLAMH